MRNPLTKLYTAFRAGLGEPRLKLKPNYDHRFDRIDESLAAIRIALVLIGLGMIALLVKVF